jgi:hypothetical protein
MEKERIADDLDTRVRPEESPSGRSPDSAREATETRGPYRGVGPKGYTRTDLAIKEDVSQRLMENSTIDASDIEVDVTAGEVILTGVARTDDERRSAERAALLAPGVRNVVNRLQVAGERAAGEPFAATRPQRAEPTEAETRLEKAAWRDRARRVGTANIAVFGIYSNRAAVEETVAALETAGFRDTDISLLLPTNTGTKDFAFGKATKAPEGGVLGAIVGAIVGGILCLLLTFGILVIPGMGPFLAAGPIVTILAGIGLVGLVGGIVGALVGLGTPEYEAKRYNGRVKGGHALLSVHADDRSWARRAEKVLGRTAGEYISRRKEGSAEFAATNRPLRRGEEYRED